MKTEMTTQQAIALYSVIESLTNQFDRDNMAERIAQLSAHRAFGNQEQDPANGKLAGYCAVCQVPWPCAIAKPKEIKVV